MGCIRRGVVGINVVWLLLGLLSWGAAKDPMEAALHVSNHCSLTRFPGLCAETLSGLGNDQHNTTFDIILSTGVNKTISETTQMSFPPNFAQLSYRLITPEAQHARNATGHCDELMKMSLKRLNQALSALRESPTKNKHDIQTWLSAAITFQQTCKETADHAHVHASALYNDLFLTQISNKMDHLSQLASISLALVNQFTSDKNNNNNRNNNHNSPRRHLIEKEEKSFPRWVSAGDRKLLQTNTIRADAVVAKDGSGNYITISEAIRAAPGNRFVIYVKAGVYKEKIHANKDGITLIGDGKYSTIIVGDDSVAAGGSTLLGSATFSITGDDFIARDIGFENTAGPKGEQAVALSVASDHAVLYRCSIVGYQDTLFALSLRQFYRECDIHGTIDFIFGNAAAVFQNCNIVLRRPGSGGAYNVILANGRTDPGQNTGFSVQNCGITAGSDFAAVKHSFTSYLGRPWKEYSRAVVMQSTIDDAIAPLGWVQWKGSGGSVLKTLYFAEFSNVGPGSGTSGRVQWPGFHLMARNDAVMFTVGNLIAGTSWLPPTGVTFINGL